MVLFFYLLFAFFLTPDGQNVSGNIQANVLRFESRQFSLHGDLTVGFRNVYRRKPFPFALDIYIDLIMKWGRSCKSPTERM